jgi:hypothetical protein
MIAIEPRTNRYLRKSIQMIKGNYIAILALTLISTTLLAVINGTLTQIFQGKTTELLIIGVIYAVIFFFVYPFASSISVIIYRQLKGSQEPFDLIEVPEARNMYCRYCGKEIDEKAPICIYCGMLVGEEKPNRKFYTAGFVLGILSLCIPVYGTILGIIGLPMACISKRTSSIIMNCIGIVVQAAFIIGVICVIYFSRGILSDLV